MRHARIVILAGCLAAFLLGAGCRVQSQKPIIAPKSDVRIMDVGGQYQFEQRSIASKDVVVGNGDGNVVLYRDRVLGLDQWTEKVLTAMPLTPESMIVQAEEDGTYIYYLLQKTDFGFVRLDVDMEKYKKIAGRVGYPEVVMGAGGDLAVAVDSLSSEDLLHFFASLRRMGVLIEDGRYLRQ